MKKLFALLVSLCLVFSCACASASSFDDLRDMLRNSATEETETPAEPADAAVPQSDTQFTLFAQDGLSILDVNCIVKADDYSSFIDCYVYAVIRNDGDSAVAVDGEIVLTDGDGNILEEQSYLFARPDVLAPGDTAMIEEYVLLSKTDAVSLPEQVAGVVLTVYADPYAYSTDAPAHVQVAAELTRSLDIYGDMVDVVRFTLTNDSGAPLRNPAVVAAVYDTDGRLVLTVEADTGVDTVILPEGGTLIIESELYDYVADYLDRSGRILATVDAMAYGD
ncbi:MAG: hypothetical protein ACI4OY_11945 [Aristaeellaceae bacterium]